MSTSGMVVLVAAAAGALYMLSRRTAGDRADSAFARRVAELCVTGLHTRLDSYGTVRDQALDAISAAMETADPNFITNARYLAPLLRIEMRLTRRHNDPLCVERSIGMLWANDSGADALTVSDTVMWHNLPTAYRERFIEKGDFKHIYLIYTRSDKGKEA